MENYWVGVSLKSVHSGVSWSLSRVAATDKFGAANTVSHHVNGR